MSEHLAFKKPGGHRRTVHLDEIAVAARAEFMNRAGYNFLASAGLAREQHGGIGGRHGLHLGEDFAQAPAAPHNRLQQRAMARSTLRILVSSRRRRVVPLVAIPRYPSTCVAKLDTTLMFHPATGYSHRG